MRKHSSGKWEPDRGSREALPDRLSRVRHPRPGRGRRQHRRHRTDPGRAARLLAGRAGTSNLAVKDRAHRDRPGRNASARDTRSSFEPQIVKKRQRRLTRIDEIVLSLPAKGLTTGEAAAHFADVYGATVAKDTISRITDGSSARCPEWCNRPLEPVYPVVFVDAIHVKIRDGQVSNRPIYVAVGVTCAGDRDILGLWAGDDGEDAKFWLSVLTEIKNRGTADVCIVVH